MAAPPIRLSVCLSVCPCGCCPEFKSNLVLVWESSCLHGPSSRTNLFFCFLQRPLLNSLLHVSNIKVPQPSTNGRTPEYYSVSPGAPDYYYYYYNLAGINYYYTYDRLGCVALMFWTRSLEVLCLNLGREADYPYWGFSWFPSVPPSEFRLSTLNRPWQLPFKSFSVHNSYTTWRYMI
jgi:hypothetical protein